jgi:hypothetical protein
VPDFNAQLLRQPVKEGLNNCIHLLGQAGGRVCMVEAVLGTNLVNNTEVSDKSTKFKVVWRIWRTCGISCVLVWCGDECAC